MHKLISNANHVIFDIGNVLLSFSPQWILDKMVPASLHKVFLSSVFGSRFWVHLDLGTLDYPEAAHRMCRADSALAPHEDLVLKLLHRFPEVMEPSPPSQLLQPLRDMGKKVYLLSNFHKGSYEQISGKHAFLSNVDGAVISAYEHCIKPGRRIYDTLLKRYSIPPQCAVFIDDMPDNVRTARRLGLAAIQYDGTQKL